MAFAAVPTDGLPSGTTLTLRTTRGVVVPTYPNPDGTGTAAQTFTTATTAYVTEGSYRVTYATGSLGGGVMTVPVDVYAPPVAQDLTAVNASLATKYVKPAGGIPEADLSSAVTTKLNAVGTGGSATSVVNGTAAGQVPVWDTVDARYEPATVEDVTATDLGAVLLSELPERVQDIVGAFITAGSGVSLTYNDASNTFTISATGGGAASLVVQDENGNVSTAVTQIDFQGAGVTVAAGTGEVVVTIPGATGGSPALSGNPTPKSQGLLGWTQDVMFATGTGVSTSGTVHLARILVPQAVAISKVLLVITTAGAGLTQAGVALYNAAGAKIAESADQATDWQTAGLKQVTLTGGPFTVGGGGELDAVYVAILSQGTTAPTIAMHVAHGSTTIAAYTAGLAANARRHVTVAGQTSFPATVDLTAAANGTTRLFWQAVSA